LSGLEGLLRQQRWVHALDCIPFGLYRRAGGCASAVELRIDCRIVLIGVGPNMRRIERKPGILPVPPRFRSAASTIARTGRSG
jgi:hypothetical protein